ncbi:MAG: SidJ-related pseudokinase [Desulfobulbaceae bacterium]|nr:SidJ-related pseudokinase [Desulfobulbaceae bacterium]
MRDCIAFEEQILEGQYYDFPAKYMAACNLHSHITSQPFSVKKETIANLEKVMQSKQILRHRQSFFLFQVTARAMAAVVETTPSSLSMFALDSLKRLLHSSSGNPHRATTEALGSLPFLIPETPSCKFERPKAFPDVSWQQITDKAGEKNDEETVFAGRSLITPLEQDDKILVIKCARQDEEVENLVTEVMWMDTLRHGNVSYPARFDIPEPVTCKGSHVFSLKNIPTPCPAKEKLHPHGLAIAFIAEKKYFAYANDPRHGNRFSDFVDVMQQNALLLGSLCSRGIVHTAPIPLFHNRVQRNRRDDNGLYDWTRGGRLDQWLNSCQYPNLGHTGLRDFEHFTRIEESGEKLYWHIGSHILSLLLVVASYFRNLQADLRGIGVNGHPVDARHLFAPAHLRKAVKKVLHAYYRGFVGESLRDELPFDHDLLLSRMIDEMGVDTHMEEILRLVDQQSMTDSELQDFLMSRNFPEKKAAATVRGIADISLLTGPHLGGFNQPISIPELIEATASMAATCVLGRFTKERNLPETA